MADDFVAYQVAFGVDDKGHSDHAGQPLQASVFRVGLEVVEVSEQLIFP